MSQEITVSSGLSAQKGSVKLTQTLSKRVDQTNAGGVQRQQSIPTTAGGTVIDLSGVTTPGWIQIKNTDTTNYVKVGPTSGGAIVALHWLKPGESCQFRIFTGVVPRAIADTAACVIDFLLLEA